MANYSNIVLTGFMGTGKTTVGKRLAELLRWEWVDTDTVIESRYGAISEIFANGGEEAFRDLEREVAAELATKTGMVVSTGGRLMLDPENIKTLGSVSRVFCLDARPSEIIRRVTEDGLVRPLVEGDHPADRVKKLLAERDEQYKQFEQVATDKLTAEQVAQDIHRRIQDSAGELTSAKIARFKERDTMEMQYRRLGTAGLKVSVFSYGSWLTFGTQQEADESLSIMEAAYKAGVNFFDNAEVYAGGEAERVMGEAFQKLAWPRNSYLVSTKYFWGIDRDVTNAYFTLNRKYLMESIDKSLERLQMDHVDLVYCHRPDPNTPIEETVWAMSDIVASGKALYWGTSEWSAQEIRAAWEIAERHHLRKPVVEQPEYNLFNRAKVEVEFARLYEDIGLGLTTFSPLASGLLTGKYADGIPEGSRGQDVEWLQGPLTDPANHAKVAELKVIADEIGCSLAQLGLAWTASNPNVSSVIIGARRLEQLNENLGALDVLDSLTDDHKAAIDEIFS